MKRVIAFIRPSMYFKTKEHLSEKGFVAMSTKECLGRGKEKADITINSANQELSIYDKQLIAKKMIDIYVRDEVKDDLIKAIMEINSTGNRGDGKIFVMPVEECIRIRSGEKSNNALV